MIMQPSSDIPTPLVSPVTIVEVLMRVETFWALDSMTQLLYICIAATQNPRLFFGHAAPGP
jgi:hypothetical protein